MSNDDEQWKIKVFQIQKFLFIACSGWYEKFKNAKKNFLKNFNFFMYHVHPMCKISQIVRDYFWLITIFYWLRGFFLILVYIVFGGWGPNCVLFYHFLLAERFLSHLCLYSLWPGSGIWLAECNHMLFKCGSWLAGTV